MILKRYLQFIKESKYEFGCVMIDIPVSNWSDIIYSIDKNDVYEKPGDDTHGIQKDPHLTLLYGLHKEVTPELVKSIFDKFTGNIKIEIDGIDIFENKDYDVVKFNVIKNTSLQYLYDQLSKLPNSNSFPDYKPHITLAYVKKGTGKKYINPDYKYTVKNVNNVVYSMPNGNNIHIPLNESYTILESNLNYGIHDWIEDLKSWEFSRPTHQPVNEVSIKKWSDHFIGQGYFEKVKDLVDRIFLSFNKVDVEEINDRMYDVYDQIPSSKDNWVMCCVVYGDVEKWGKPNKFKYNGLMTVARKDARDRQRIMTAILKDIVYPTLYIGSYPNMLLRQSYESYYVTDPKWKCANFNIDDYQEMGIRAGAEFETDESNGRKTSISDFDIQKKKEYSIDKFFDMYKPAVVIEIGNRDHSIAKGGMNLIKLESMIDETLESILPTLDYQEILWDMSRFDRKFDEDTDVYDYTVKILLNLK